MRRLLLPVALLVALAGCGSGSNPAFSSNSPPPSLPAFNPAAHGFHKAGALWTSCKLTYSDGVPTGAHLVFYNPDQASPVHVNGIGVELISNGVLLQELPVQTGEFPGVIAAGIEIPDSVTFGGGVSATSCRAGWR